ncbi:phosphotransferase [Flavobacterium luteum]|uniref:Phosphotransferase n=1 Tax=Flavobacterium luteum TaxID=2026654 RepID=A0A7J5AE20_9FLAO|nr:phosphotransferase [Flavobacterium luteum]KAB1155790.1 phosphotransferase [Flavobacterium luteum]
MQKNKRIYFFYSPFTLITKIFWKLLLNSNFFQSFFTCSQSNLPSSIQTILRLLDSNDAKFQIKRGTKGPDQKITLIMHANLDKTTFFKIGNTNRGIELIKNEYSILKELEGKFNAPHIINYYKKDEFLFMETDYIAAPKVKSTAINECISKYILSIASYKLNSNETYIKSFNHGDCCPWNLLYLEHNKVLLIDWELAGENILGYDLFTFIFQPPFLLNPNKSNRSILEDNVIWIKIFFSHFQVDNWIDYLSIFINSKIESENKKLNDSQLIKKYLQLQEDLPNLEL